MDADCSWCGAKVPEEDGLRLAEPELERRAAFCRLEHVVPWATQEDPVWQPGAIVPDGEPDDALGRCAHCGGPLGEDRVLLVRHRGEHRFGDAFCRTGHLLDWAEASQAA